MCGKKVSSWPHDKNGFLSKFLTLNCFQNCRISLKMLRARSGSGLKARIRTNHSRPVRFFAVYVSARFLPIENDNFLRDESHASYTTAANFKNYWRLIILFETLVQQSSNERFSSICWYLIYRSGTGPDPCGPRVRSSFPDTDQQYGPQGGTGQVRFYLLTLLQSTFRAKVCAPEVKCKSLSS